MTQLTTTVPFSGFYHAHEITLEDHAEVWQSIEGEDAEQDLDWAAIYEDFAKRYTLELAGALGITLEYVELKRPREYNFSTDQIMARISQEDADKMYEAIPHDLFSSVVKEALEPRPGFIPFHSSNYLQWGGIPVWKPAQIGLLLEAFMFHQLGPDLGAHGTWELENQIVEQDLDLDAIICAGMKS